MSVQQSQPSRHPPKGLSTSYPLPQNVISDPRWKTASLCCSNQQSIWNLSCADKFGGAGIILWRFSLREHISCIFSSFSPTANLLNKEGVGICYCGMGSVPALTGPSHILATQMFETLSSSFSDGPGLGRAACRWYTNTLDLYWHYNIPKICLYIRKVGIAIYSPSSKFTCHQQLK